MVSVSAVKTANRQIAGAAATIMLGFILSQLFGLVRQILATRAFGTTPAMDAFTTASTYPDFIFSLVASGALASAFIPTFTGQLAKEDYPAAWRLASAVINLVVLILAVLSLVSILLAPQIVRTILAPKFPAAEQALCADLLRIRLLTPVIFGISGLLMGVLNTHRRFFLPALAPSMNWLGMIFGLLFLAPSLGIYGYAWGAALGAVLHLAIQLPDLFRLPKRTYFPILGLNNPNVRHVGILMAPRLVGVAAVQLNFLANTILANYQPEAVTVIGLAWMILTVPEIVIAQSIAIAALPTFSAQVARGELGEMRASLSATLRSVVLLSLPASLGLILLGRPVIVLFFQHGAFTAHSTDMTMWALIWYAGGLLGHAVVEVLSRAFYAMHDTRTPVTTTTIAMGLNIGLSLVFMRLFSQLGWAPFGGLALANSLATGLEGIALLILMRRRLHGLQDRSLLTGLGQAFLATACMSVCVWGWVALTPGLPGILIVAGGLAIGGGSYLLVTWLLKVPELIELVLLVVRRAKGILFKA
jgi:putative peptidoglycan lipid II flippase